MPGEPQLQEAGDPLGNEADRLKDAQRGTTSFGDRNLDDDEDTKEKHKKHDGHDKHSEKAKNKWSLQRFTPKKVGVLMVCQISFDGNLLKTFYRSLQLMRVSMVWRTEQ